MSEKNETKVAVITGAGSGVGRNTALLMAEAGYAVVLASRTETDLRETVKYLEKEGTAEVKSLVVPTDVTKSDQVEKLIAAALEEFGRVDAVANCAGSAPLQPIDRITDEVIDEALAVNLKSVIYVTRALWPHFKERKQEEGQRAICNISSMASIDPFKGFNVYAAAKAGVNLFTKATADEGKRLSVTAAAVAPGAIETPMLRQNFSTGAIPEDNSLDPLIVAGLVRDVLTGKRPDDNGQTIPLPSPH